MKTSPENSLRRRRLLLLIPSLGGGGAEQVFVTLLRHLDRRRFDIHLGVLRAAGAFASEVSSDVTVHDLQVQRIRYSAPKLVRLVRRLQPDVILSTMGDLNIVTLLARPAFPRHTRVVVRPDSMIANLRAHHGRLYQSLWMALCRFAYMRADRIVCQSDYMATELASAMHLHGHTLTRIYNPVDVERIERLAAQGSPFNGDGPNLVASGRLEHVKGFDLLLPAFARVREVIPSAQLTILGTGSLEQRLRRFCAELGIEKAVHLPGFCSNPYPYYKHADVFVLSSRFEGLPNAMLEAAVLGTRIVATDCEGGVRELVPYIPGARIASKQNPEAITDAIVYSLCFAPAKWGRSDLLAQVRADVVVREYERVLLEVMSPSIHSPFIAEIDCLAASNCSAIKSNETNNVSA
jgi:glycosyltransferase involved in cell wall biosynthesis